MIARISTTFPGDVELLWGEISKIESLLHVCAPILKFKTANGSQSPKEWDIDSPYHFRLSLFGLIPLGEHIITLRTINRADNLIISQERGSLAPVWNHTISFSTKSPGSMTYADEIEIRAGILTPFIWAFAHVFYRHRQRRWKKLLRHKLRSEKL